ncbi:MAG: [Fe-Fe] hydrogenase large subunit C-terminal domain-containing protein [Phycisphaerae bacterium]
MRYTPNIPLVKTIKERCRVCYTCVRECPAKAIRIAAAQAEVIPERCIGCGNCVRVCSQQAKEVLGSRHQVEQLLAGKGPVAACLAPSFPAEFFECDDLRLVGMLRKLGFTYVNEVAFGADLTADRYRRLLAANANGNRYIATTCPAIVAYVERYHPDVSACLAPIVSPMIATARALHHRYGRDLKVVFIGPCIAKKGEVASDALRGEMDAALTFVELREILKDKGIAPDTAGASEFDPPHGGVGALFPISRGLFQAADIREDLLAGRIVATDGRRNFVEALREFAAGDLSASLLEVLCCEGCIMGAGMSTDSPLFFRRNLVSQHVRKRLTRLDMVQWRRDMEAFADLDLSRTFKPDDQRMTVPFRDEIAQIMARMGKFTPEDELNCGACGYDSCQEHAVAIFKGLAESEMCLPYTIEQLKKTVKELAASNEQLATAQEALMQSEKLASMGQLAAGIAHEVNNPLGVVLMYSHLLQEETGDPKLRDDLGTIAREADRCKKIVAGLLDFARQNKVNVQEVALRDLVDQALKAVPAPAGVEVRVEDIRGDGTGDRPYTAELDRDQVVQVLTNLISNAIAAMPSGGVLTIRAGGDERTAVLEVADTGVGIPPENIKKIFEPFFTTKPIGKGTGLGLAVTYGIVKMHRGDISVQSNALPENGPTGSTFKVTLPRQQPT